MYGSMPDNITQLIREVFNPEKSVSYIKYYGAMSIMFHSDKSKKTIIDVFRSNIPKTSPFWIISKMKDNFIDMSLTYKKNIELLESDPVDLVLGDLDKIILISRGIMNKLNTLKTEVNENIIIKENDNNIHIQNNEIVDPEIEINRILDKINAFGKDSLTEDEKTFLKNNSK